MEISQKSLSITSNNSSMSTYREQVKQNNNLVPSQMSQGLNVFSEKFWYKYNTCIAKHIGVDEAIIFGVFAGLNAYWLSRSRIKKFILNKFWIQADYDFIRSRVFLSTYRQKTATDKLKLFKFLEVKHSEGNRKWVKINWDVVNLKMSEWYVDMIYFSDESIDNEQDSENIDM